MTEKMKINVFADHTIVETYLRNRKKKPTCIHAQAGSLLSRVYDIFHVILSNCISLYYNIIDGSYRLFPPGFVPLGM